MDHEIKRPLLDGDQEAGEEVKRHEECSRSVRFSKWRRVLAALYSGRSFNRFEAARDLHDHCLHSTIADLQAKLLTIHRREETVPGYLGIPTRVCRYWLAEESRDKAAELLGIVRELTE